MEINIERIDDEFKLKAVNETGQVAYTDGSMAIGGSQTAFRPMQMLMLSLAGCSAIDIISILKKQRQEITDFKMNVKGVRNEGIPSPFKKINVHFSVEGNVKEVKLQRAIKMAETKYCSVHFSLHPDIEITYTFDLNSKIDSTNL